MNFSELFKHSGQLCKCSPDGKFLASVVEFRIIVRDVQTLQIQHLFSCLDAVQYIEWSSDSEFILCGMYKRGIIQVWSLEQPEWQCKIDEGSAGLCAVRWSPDGRHILATADFYLRITVWSLVTKSVSYIKHPKQCQKGIAFSNGGKYMAVAERRDCKDHISVFECDTWNMIKNYEPETNDLCGLEWSPDGRTLAVWDSPLEYRVLTYSLDGRCLGNYSPYKHALGVKKIAWAPTSQFLVVGSYDEKVRLLNNITWKKFCEFSHPETIEKEDVIVYKEVDVRGPVPTGKLSAMTSTLFQTQSKYETVSVPVKIPVVKPDTNKANPKCGVGLLAFSNDCRYIYSRNDNMPTALWIWDIRELALKTVLLQSSPIKCVEWDPTQTRLALSTANNKLYMWSPSGCLSVIVPSESAFNVHSLKWHKDGNAVILLGKDQMCLCYLSVENSDQSVIEDVM